MTNNPPVSAGTRIGHVHLKVADLDRALGFYCDVLGFELMQRMGSGAAFISAGGYNHHIGLNTWESKGGSPPPALTASARQFICAIVTRAASSSGASWRRSNGRSGRTAGSLCSPSGW